MKFALGDLLHTLVESPRCSQMRVSVKPQFRRQLKPIASRCHIGLAFGRLRAIERCTASYERAKGFVVDPTLPGMQ